MNPLPALSLSKGRYSLVALALALLVAGACLAPAAFAKLALNTIDTLATVSNSGHRVRVTGPIEVQPAGEWVEQRVTVTQRSTGAVAEGFVRFRGTGASQTWEVVCHTLGKQKFVPGDATAVGLARTSLKGKATDAHQWLVNITLEAP